MDSIHPELQQAFDWIDAHRDECIADLRHLVQQPSVSAQNIGLSECAELVVEMMHADGLDATAHATPGGPPCVIGHMPSTSSQRTLLAHLRGAYQLGDGCQLQPGWAFRPFGKYRHDAAAVGG